MTTYIDQMCIINLLNWRYLTSHRPQKILHQLTLGYGKRHSHISDGAPPLIQKLTQRNLSCKMQSMLALKIRVVYMTSLKSWSWLSSETPHQQIYLFLCYYLLCTIYRRSGDETGSPAACLAFWCGTQSRNKEFRRVKWRRVSVTHQVTWLCLENAFGTSRVHPPLYLKSGGKALHREGIVLQDTEHIHPS